MHSDTCVTPALLSLLMIVASIILFFVGAVTGQLIRKCKQLQIKEKTDGRKTSDLKLERNMAYDIVKLS